MSKETETNEIVGFKKIRMDNEREVVSLLLTIFFFFRQMLGVDVFCSDGTFARAAVPSGASTVAAAVVA
ncbi:hypothetical protein ZWY2020_006545 [Hordeum vulgare]|nr:hypothetical protein ZWY2020_006545 [Hordeum vulgare]